MSFTITKPGFYRTRDGRKYRVLCTDAPGDYPVVGYSFNEGDRGVGPSTHTVNGTFEISREGVFDLISEWIDAPILDWSREREWVKAVAMGVENGWWRFDAVPTVGTYGWKFDSGRSDSCQRMHPSEYPANPDSTPWTGDWKASLIVRPEGGKL